MVDHLGANRTSVRRPERSQAHSNVGRVAQTVCCPGALLCAAQPKCAKGDDSKRLRSTDVLLLLNFIESQKKALVETEVWTPVCLPRFNDRGFLHAYVAFLEPTSGLCLVLLAGDESHETFRTFRDMRVAIEAALRRDGVFDAAVDAATRDGNVRALLPPSCLHFAVATRETSSTDAAAADYDPGAAKPPKQAIAQCVATDGFEPESTWLAYETLALQCVKHPDPLRVANAHDALELRACSALAFSTTRGLTYVALPGPRFLLFATFPAHVTLRHVADYTAKLVRTLDHHGPALFGEPCLY